MSPPSKDTVGPFSGLEGLRASGMLKTEKGKHMALYEHIFLARQDVTAQQVEAMTEQFKSVIEANGGKVAKVEYWGVKSLAYRIKKNRKAHYVMFNIDAPPAAVAEMERNMRINEDVLRHMTVQKKKAETGPSLMMKTVEREEARKAQQAEFAA